MTTEMRRLNPMFRHAGFGIIILSSLCAVGRMAVAEDKIDIQALTQETQRGSHNPGEISLVWWLPEERRWIPPSTRAWTPPTAIRA